MSKHDDLQATDDTDVSVTAEHLINERSRKKRERETLAAEAEVRVLLDEALKALSGDSDYHPETVINELHWYLWHDPKRKTVLDPENEELSREMKAKFRSLHRDRTQGIRPDPETEIKVLAEVAKAQDYISGLADMSRYAPVQLQEISEPSANSVEDPTPVGRRRIGADDTASIEQRRVEIPHKSCDHVLAVALPRSGKDSTLVSFAKNLKEEHGYSFFSILDDGRMETPMMAIPNDDQAIIDNLERMGQEPEGMRAEVFVPAMSMPEYLPANFRPFTIGIDSLTPNLILRLAGVTTSDETSEQRIKRALDKTMDNSRQVTELITRLRAYAEEMEASIEWTELRTRDGETETETYTTTYSMEREKALQTAATRLAQLAGEGLIASPDASTNIDMQEVIADQETASVLCCNFLDHGNEPLKYTIMDLWLRLIYKARDNNPRLPRVCLGVRELKNVAPSKLGDVRYKDPIKALRQTLFFLSTQGGSRRIMLLGSTQKMNDVYKPVRTNMAQKVLLRLNEEEIETLDRSHNFSQEQKQQLSEFDIGMGMIMAGGRPYWPIELRGAPCGLGLGDQHWLDRYGLAWGARVRQTKGDNWQQRFGDVDWWVHTMDAEVVTPEDRPPSIGETYSEWYLLPQDFEDVLGEVPSEEEIDYDLVQEVLAERRDDGVKSDLRIQPTGYEHRQRDLALESLDENTTIDDLADEFNIPQPCRPWLDVQQRKRERLVEAIEVIDEQTIERRKDFDDHLSYPGNTVANYLADDEALGKLVEKTGHQGTYALKPAGEQALSVDWDGLEDALSEADV